MKTLLLFLAGILCFVSYAQDGSLDTSFGDAGIVITDLENSQDFGYTVAEQTDHKLIVSGVMSSNFDDYYPYLIRYMPDGSVDTSFGTNGKIISDYGIGFNSYSYLFLDNEQHILAAGNMGFDSNFVIAKYTENGDLDTNFGSSGVLNITDGNYSGMALLEDGSILLLKFSGSAEITVNHYLNNGDLDTSFGINGAATSTFSGDIFSGKGIKIDGEDNIYFLGTRNNNANSDIILMKFQPNGYLDSNFGDNGTATQNIDALNPMNFSTASLDLTNDGKIVIAGSCGACVDLFEPVMQPFFIRYQNDGSPDPNFGNNGIVLLPISEFSISQLIIQQNQRMIVGGSFLDCFEGSIYGIHRYYQDGTEDYSFLGGGFEFDYSKSILQEDGKIISLGTTFWYNGIEDIVLLRHNNNPLSVPEFEINKITIYPNPSNGIFTIEHKFFEPTAYQITDITGKKIALGELNDTQTQIDLSSAQSGVYFLKTSSGVFRLLKD
jgi:uncharacterized delta-60 repeat protein